MPAENCDAPGTLHTPQTALTMLTWANKPDRCSPSDTLYFGSHHPTSCGWTGCSQEGPDEYKWSFTAVPAKDITFHRDKHKA